MYLGCKHTEMGLWGDLERRVKKREGLQRVGMKIICPGILLKITMKSVANC